tara:strand:+ start:113 stop:1366 length:1254 start_codon:yes stop_codon:yes gene_type:complete
METEDKDMVMTNEKCLYHIDDCTWSEIEEEFIHNDDVKTVHGGDIVSENYRDNEYQLCEDTDEYHPNDETWFCEIREVYYSDNENSLMSYCGDFEGHYDSFDNDYNWVWVEKGMASENWVHIDYASHCIDIEGYVYCDDANWCEVDEEYYYDEDNMPCDSEPDCIQSYHSNNNPIDLNYNYTKSLFSIGFEVEKTEFMDGADSEGDYVGTYDIFEGFETDSSCGVEAVTKILPLGGPRSEARKEVFKMMDEASDVIDCPTDFNCGGHITVSFKDMQLYGDGYDMANRMRGAMSLIYALYRYRLKKSYCAMNKGIKKENNTKYSPVNIKGRLVELRLPSRIKNVKQLKLRYDLMYKVMYYSLVKQVSYDVFMQKARHIVLKMYDGDNDKVDMIYSISNDFRKYLVNDEVSTKIEQYIN